MIVIEAAVVKKATGKTKNIVADSPKMIVVAALPDAAKVQIVEEPDGYLLIRYAEDGKYAGDSWFESIDECKMQAEFEFGIEAGDWTK